MDFTNEGNNEKKLYFNNDFVLITLLAKQDDILETGLAFDGEVRIDDNISIITEKEVKLDEGLPDTHKTYLKVMEMRELTEEEMKYANKTREFLSKMFNIMFYNKKLMISWTIIVATALGINIVEGDFLGIALKSFCLLVVNRPIKFIKEVIKMFKRDAKIEELSEYLRDKQVLGLVNSVDDKNDIKMYAKLR